MKNNYINFEEFAFTLPTSNDLRIASRVRQREDKSTSKRFATINKTSGALSRVGSALVTGSAFPQGNQFYSQVTNKIYTISGDSTSLLSILDLTTNTSSSISSSATTLLGFADDENVIFAANTTGDPHRILKIDVDAGTETTFVSAPPTGYDSLGSAYINIADNELIVNLGKSGGDGIAVYNLTTGVLKQTFDTTGIGQGRWVNSSFIKKVDSGTETLATNIESQITNLVKLGSGTLNMTGTNSYTGTTAIKEGQLFINGTASSSTAKISSGAKLGGTGTVGAIVSDGNIEPGNSIGTLNVSGTVTLNSGSVLVIEVDTAGNTDKIVATGAVTAGGTLRISPGSGTYSSGQQYTIITGSSISGTFSTITVLSCTGTASASYGSTSITITLSNCVFNAPKNRETISSYVNDLSSGASGDLSTVITALNTLSGDNYNNALDALDYNTSGAISSVVQSQVASINNVIGQRVAASTIGNNKVVSLVGFIKSSSTIDQSNTLSFKDKLKQMGMTGWWTQVHGGTGDKKSLKDIGVNGYDFNHFGTTIGFDQQTDKGTEGYALTFQQGNIDSDNSEGSTDHKTFAVSKYQSTSIDNGKRRTLSGSFGITNVDSSRTLNFASINRKATASYNSYSLNGSAEYIYPEKNWFGSAHNLSVNGGLTLNYQEGFTETGANSLNLKVDSNHTQIANAGLVDTIYWSDKTEGETIPFLSLGLHTSYHLGSVESKQRFVNQTNFTTKSDRRSNTHGEIGLGFIQSKDNNTELSFLAKSKFSDKLSENTATFKYSVKF